ncbi:hypothetical protein LCGC14_1092190 [marine sediment metagenome]|uniref:Uncharacterized protein n=1 Tax=marine sediment metagenome TaxID=412755 RepID=A0A0F9PV57_9ZZZZ
MEVLIKTDKKIEISKEDFEDYERVRSEGLTNMFFISQVVELSNNLDKDKCIAIMENYKKLNLEFPEVRKS